METSGPTQIIFAIGLILSLIGYNQLKPPSSVFGNSLWNRQAECNARTLETSLGRIGCNSAGRTGHFISIRN